MPQKIIDLSVAIPSKIGVRLEQDGPVYDLPGDIPVPQYLELEQLTERLNAAQASREGEDFNDALSELYELIMELFRINQPELEELPLGAKRLSVLILALYTGAVTEDAEREAKPERPSRRAGKTKTSQTRKPKTTGTRSRSSR